MNTKKSGMRGMGVSNPQPKAKPGKRRVGPKLPVKKAKMSMHNSYGGG